MTTPALPSITASSLQIAPGICFSPATADGCIVLNVERGTVLSLNETGARMFAKLIAGRCSTRNEFLDLVCSDFQGVKSIRVETAVDSLLSQLVNKGVLQTRQSKVSQWAWSLRSGFGRIVARSANVAVKPLLIIRADAIAAFLLLAAADAILSMAGFHSLYQAVNAWSIKANGLGGPQLITRLRFAAEQACTWYPKQALCLQRSVVLTWILRSCGVKGEMVIGVHKMPFYGHAWVELEGKVLNDDANVQNFFQLVSRC